MGFNEIVDDYVAKEMLYNKVLDLIKEAEKLQKLTDELKSRSVKLTMSAYKLAKVANAHRVDPGLVEEATNGIFQK